MIKANSVIGLIGHTPVVKLNRLLGDRSVEVYVKLESFNPGGSVKDRAALYMIEAAEVAGLLRPGSTIIEPTSGNTGIGLAMIAAARAYKTIFVMPESMSLERRNLLKAYGAEIILTPASEGMGGAIRRAEAEANANPTYFLPQQFANQANPEAHRKTTALEIIEQMEGKLDIFVAGVGSGGTISGVGEVLKERLPGIEIAAIEPAGSPVLSGGQPGPHKIQGIGAGFIPPILKVDLYDRVIQVTNENAFAMARRAAREEGLLVGISSGAALWAALEIAKEAKPGTRILAIAPDTGERYLSTELFTNNG